MVTIKQVGAGIGGVIVGALITRATWDIAWRLSGENPVRSWEINMVVEGTKLGGGLYAWSRLGGIPSAAALGLATESTLPFLLSGIMTIMGTEFWPPIATS